MAKIIPGAGVVAIQNNKVLLIKHSSGAGHVTGSIGLPAGGIDKKETAKEAAARELFEETGLQSTHLEVFKHNTFIAEILRNNGTTKIFSGQYFVTIQVEGTLKESEEGTPFWASLEKLDNLELLPNNKKVIQNALKHLETPTYKISIIAAIGKNRELGKTGKIPWYIPGELKRFKKITMGTPIIMGRKTFESIGKVLPGRMNIIITRNNDYTIKDAHIVNSLSEAISRAKINNHREIFIIGGGEIYKEALPLADKLYLTIIDENFEADTYFPKYENIFTKEVSKSDIFKADDLSYYFMELEKN